MAAAFGQRHNTPMPSQQPPKRGLSGCALAAIIGAVLFVVAIPVVAILAAIAIPQYQDYIARTKVQQVYLQAVALEQSIDTHRRQTGECPNNSALGLEDSVERFGAHVASVQVGAVESGNCAIEITFAQLSPAVDGKTLLFESTETGWNCNGGTLWPNHRPPQCR